jgi:hypothetical protein
MSPASANRPTTRFVSGSISKGPASVACRIVPEPVVCVKVEFHRGEPIRATIWLVRGSIRVSTPPPQSPEATRTAVASADSRPPTRTRHDPPGTLVGDAHHPSK